MALPPPRMPGSEGGIFPPVAPSKQTLRAAFADKDALKASCDAASRRAEGKAVAKFGHHPRHITGSDGLRYARWLPDVLFDKVQQDASMLTQEERAAAEARVLPIRESILPIMRGAMKGFLSRARLDLMAAELGLQKKDMWGPNQR